MSAKRSVMSKAVDTGDPPTQLGICTRYGNFEAADAAVRIANCARHHGIDVSMLSVRPDPRDMQCDWDARVLTPKRVTFSNWSTARRWLLWTAVPHIEQVIYAASHDIRTAVFVLWHELDPVLLSVLDAVDVVLCPEASVQEYLISYGLRNTRLASWDNGSVFYTKSELSDKRRILLPLWDGNTNRTESTVIDVLDRLLHRNPRVTATIAVSSSSLDPYGYEKIRKLVKNGKGRVALKRGVPRAYRPLLASQHDLTLVAHHFENMNTTAVESINAGTPVAGFRLRPATSLLTNSNSITVDCREIYNSIGVPISIPDYAALDELLYYSLRDDAHLNHLQATVAGVRQPRRENFETGVSVLWS